MIPCAHPVDNRFWIHTTACPLITVTRTLFTVDCSCVQRAVSVVQMFGNQQVWAKGEHKESTRRIERQRSSEAVLTFKHDWNMLYCLNVYCVWYCFVFVYVVAEIIATSLHCSKLPLRGCVRIDNEITAWQLSGTMTVRDWYQGWLPGKHSPRQKLLYRGWFRHS